MNVFRQKWAVSSVPTLVKFEKKDGGLREVGRLVEDEILDQQKLKALIAGNSA